MHEVLRVPHLVRDEAAIRRVMGERGCDYASAYVWLLEQRAGLIARMKADPLGCGYEPGIWAVADALLGLDLQRPEWRGKTGLDWGEWAEALRRWLGFDAPVQVLWASGANRSGKSTWASKRTVEVLLSRDRAIAWCFDQSGPISIDRQQLWVHAFLPVAVRARRAIKGQHEYVNFSEQNGFTGAKFTLPERLSKCEFKNYMQEKMLIEGGEIDWAYCEENVPPDWLETVRGRVGGGRRALAAVAYTPINGWNGTVNLFMQNAVVAKSCAAYLLPCDGGEPDVARALGFRDGEEMGQAHEEGRWSVPEDCLGWLGQEREGDCARKDLDRRPVRVGGRLFERMPRVMRCPDFNAAVVFFHPMDNPFGNPLAVWETWRKATTETVRQRLYGWATETTSPVFTRFSSSVHVVPADAVPEDGTNYLFIDPAGGRNWFMLWIRVTRGGKAYVYREWPGPYPIKGGLLGSWAEVSGRNEGVNDGKKGPAQAGIGFTIMDYVGEWARLEGWPEGWRQRVAAFEAESVEGEERDEWGDRKRPGIALERFRAAGLEDYPAPDAGARERVHARIMDCRAANTASQSRQGVVTPLTVLSDMGLDVETSVPVSINGLEDSGIDLVNGLLAWDGERELGADNSPELMFSDACPNVVWAMANWRNVDGNKGACKDPVDLIRYFAGGSYGWEG